MEEGDLFDYWRQLPAGQLDLIVSNPPYLTAGEMEHLQPETAREPAMALAAGEDGLDFYRAISSQWGTALRLGGSLVFEVGAGQAPAVERIMAEHGFENIVTHQDTQGIWRVVEGTVNYC